jgi:hypothetical protein
LADTYPPSFTDPVGDLTAALFASLRDDQKLVATERRQADIQAREKELKDSGEYGL